MRIGNPHSGSKHMRFLTVYLEYIYIYLYNFYSSVNVVDSMVIGLGMFLRVTHKFTKCPFRRWMSDKKKYLYIFFNKKTNQNSLNFVSMRFFHHRVMFFSLLLRCWYFISFLSPILAIWISVLYSVEAIQIIKFHMRSGKFVRIIISPASICICYVYAMNLKRKSFDCFFLNFVTFSHSVSRLTLFFSLLVTISAVVLVAHTTHISVKHFSVKQRSEINNWNLIFIKIERLFDMQ